MKYNTSMSSNYTNEEVTVSVYSACMANHVPILCL